jgi:hypothetical protein
MLLRINWEAPQAHQHLMAALLPQVYVLAAAENASRRLHR